MTATEEPAAQPDYFPPSAERDPDDLIAGCPHMYPDKRPRGSNCHGIFPEQCGADEASAYVGRDATPALRERIAGFSPNGDVRFIKPGEPVIEDLRYGRLNVHLTEGGTIESVDCY